MIAVIITIMVLEIKVPHANGFEGLRQLAPGLLIYLMSFSFTGIYWLNHQHLAKRLKKAGHLMQCANLAFLFCLSLLPLGTAYVVDKELTGFAVAVYATSLLIVALAFLWFRLSVYRHLNQRGEMQKGRPLGSAQPSFEHPGLRRQHRVRFLLSPHGTRRNWIAYFSMDASELVDAPGEDARVMGSRAITVHRH